MPSRPQRQAVGGRASIAILLKHGQHKPRPKQRLVGRSAYACRPPPHKRTRWRVPSGFDGRGCLSPLVLATLKLVACGGRSVGNPRFWVRLLVAPLPCRTWRRQGRPRRGLHPRPSAPGGTHTGRVWSSSSSVARDPEISSTWLAKCRQSRHARLPHGSWGMLLGALASSRRLRKWRRRTGKSVRSLGFCSSVPKLVLRPESSCLPGHAWACLLPFACRDARMRRGDGGRWLVCSRHCVRNGRVSGDWRVWACWIPARAATTSPASRFSRRPKRAPALAAVGFLCCIPIAKAFHCPERPVFAPALHPSGPRRGVDLKAPAVSHVPRTAARARVVGPLRRRPISRMRNTRWVPRPRPLFAPKASVRRFVRTTPATVLGSSHAGGRGRYSLFDGTCYSDNRSNSRANTCNKPRLLEGMHLLDKRSTRAPPVAAMIHDNSTDRTALVPATHHSNFCPINFRWVRFRRGSLRNGYHIQGRQQARKLPNPDTGRIHWRASLVPAAAVIPAPIAWTLGWAGRSASGVHRSSRPFCRRCAPGLNWPGRASGAVTLKKLECSKQAYALYTLAWDNIIGFRSYYVGLRDRSND
ncbi:UNVERIFIED_CONTAM: hypothetical protein Sindi_1693200 [Sesamum indicum]